MSRLVYATQIRCDWPAGCQVTGTIPDNGLDQWKNAPPEGWASLMPGVRDITNKELRDFCPEHAALPLKDLADYLDSWMNPKEPADVGT